MKQVKIIILICVILAVGIIVVFPYLKRPSQLLERNTYCDGYSIQANKADSTISVQAAYRNCIKDYAQP